MKTGICSPIERAEAVKSAGYAFIEPSLAAISHMSDDDFEAAVRNLSASGVEVNSVNNFFDGKKHRLVGPDFDIELLREYTAAALKRAARLGCTVAVLGSGAGRSIPDGFDPKTAFEQFVSVVKMCASEAEPYGITIAIEALNSGETNLCNTAAETAEVIWACDMPNIGMTADVFHLEKAGGFIQALREYSSLIAHVHLCCPETRSGCTENDSFDYEMLRRCLADYGYRGEVCMEWRVGDFEADILNARPVFRFFEDVRSLEFDRELIANITPCMRYNGGDFAAWQQSAREKLNELLGLPFTRCEPNMKVEYTVERDGYTETRFTFESEPGYTVPCVMLMPNGVEKAPVAICLQGHSSGFHISLGRKKYERDEHYLERWSYATQAVKQGFCTLALEQRAFGERGNAPDGVAACGWTVSASLLTGRTVIGERVWDVCRAIDLLYTIPQADTSFILCIGNSGGGTASFYAACLDERITVCAPSCSYCTFADSIGIARHCPCNFIPGIAKYFDMSDLSGLVAPRFFAAQAGKRDGGFRIDGVRRAFAVTQKLYEAAGAPDRCFLREGDGGHMFYPELAWPLVADILKMHREMSEK